MSKLIRRAAYGSTFVIAGFIVLQVANAIRADALGMLSGSKALVDRVEQASASARAEYQEIALATMPANPNNGASFRLDSNYFDAEIVPELAPGDSDADSSFLTDWEFDGTDAVSFAASRGASTVAMSDGRLVVRQSGADTLVNETPLSIPLRDLAEIVVRARSDAGTRFRLAWAVSGREDLLNRNELSLDLISDGEFHTYVINAQRAFDQRTVNDESQSTTISTLAITPSNVDGANVEIEFIRITSKLERYQRLPVGTNYETVGYQTRPVLYVVPEHELVYEVDVPQDGPKLSFGLASLLDGSPIGFEISVRSNDAESSLLQTATIGFEAWDDVEVDLAPWAGQRVDLALSVSGSAANVLFLSSPVIRSDPARRFNVIFIVEDTLRADHLSSLGYERDTSPFKSKFVADNGVVFLNAHAQATQTRPSVPSYMTSLYPSATGVWNFSEMLSERYLTIAEIFQQQGFETASFFQNPNAGPAAGLHQGFDRSVRFDNDSMSSEDIFGGQVLDWLDEHGDRNFFLYLHALDPHGVYDPPAPYDQWFRTAEADLQKQGSGVSSSYLDPEWLDRATAESRSLLYDGEIRHNDAALQAFIGELEDRQLLENTLIVFTSDHGEWLGERGQWDHHPPGLRPVIHVPLMMVYPEFAGTGRQVSEAVQLIDIMPTILDLASVDSDGLLLHGDSLVSLIREQETEYWKNRLTVSQEPTLMSRESPCVCGSVFYGDLQIHGSSRDGGQPRGRMGSAVFPFFATDVFRYAADDPIAIRLFEADLTIRMLRHRALSRLTSANVELWRKLTAGEALNEYRMDPAALEELRGLGYVN